MDLIEVEPVIAQLDALMRTSRANARAGTC